MGNKPGKLIFFILLIVIALFPFDYLCAEEEDRKITETYIIKKGDTLWDVSEKILEDPFRWPDVWKNNNYIINPDLIYPGNKLLLKKLMQPALPELEEKKDVKAKRKIPKPRKKRIAKPITPALPEKIPVTKMSVFLMAGFISREDFRVGSIIDSPLDRFTLSNGDNVYTNIGPKKNATIGKKYSIYRMVREVKHPITQEEMGFLVKIIGALEIKEFIEDRSAALITDSYEEIARNDLITDRIELEIPMIDPSLQPQEKDIQGYIIEAKDERRSIGRRDIVYPDIGIKQGVVPGDMFVTFKTKEETSVTFTKKVIFQYPKIPIGELKIISTRDETATALVTKSVQELSIGEKVEYKSPEKAK